MNAVPLRSVSDPKPRVLLDGVTQDSLALTLEHRYRDQFRYCHTKGGWYHWEGSRWAWDDSCIAEAVAREICRHYGEKRHMTANTVASVLKLASSARHFSKTADSFDADPWLLGTPGGTIDLRTGELRPANPDDLITKQSGTTPAPSGTTPVLWLKFLYETTGADDGLIRFLQQLCGYALTGDTSAHALFFVYGIGGNGKSVFMNILVGVLGDYACVSAMETFAASGQDRHTTELARLMGARLVTAQETEEGKRWAEARIKAVTGGDPITARFMRQDEFTYHPQFKLVIAGNHKPGLRNVDEAIKRRLHLIPFNRRPASPDPHLEAKLREELPAILRWMIDGCLDFQSNGLVRPSVVLEATREYFEDQDLFSQWVADKCEPRLFETTANLFASWRRYSEAAGESPGSAKAFGEAMRKHGYKPLKNVPGFHGRRGFEGISLQHKNEPDRRFSDDD